MTSRPRAGAHIVVAIVQARLGSVRMPGKVLLPALGRPLLAHLIDRLHRAKTIDQVVLAIPETDGNDALVAFAEAHGINCYRGAENDVLDRYFHAAESVAASVVVRITGDCPLVDPDLADRVVDALVSGNLDYVRTADAFPDGFDVEAFTMEALHRAWASATARYDREHVTPYLRRAPANRVDEVTPDTPMPDVRVTLDEPEDAVVLTAVFEAFGHNNFSLGDVVELARTRPDLFIANRATRRNEGAEMGSGEKLWRRAKRVIPGGSMLLSKRSEMHLPRGWPAYYSRAAGCRVWDLDGNELVDVGLMGVGTNILGYGHPKVDEAVRRVIDAGNLSTLNCPEEVELAEALVALHPWADMARFTRSGGEACAVAVRIARAASGKSGVAFCGYHGWHDWYLAANLSEDSALDGHLLPGLDPAGVPRALEGSSRPFTYNDLASLEDVLAGGDIGVIFMEVRRSSDPTAGFLAGVRELADRHGAVLVFDECTSGFRRDLGGTHLGERVEPDVVTFGKALGNGYAIAAVIGREAVMQAAQSTFISSTFWTERIGPAAAVAALDVMREEGAPRRIHAIGLDVRRRWEQLAQRSGLPIVTGGLPALGGFMVPHLDPVAVKTYVTQELLGQGFLAGTVLYASIAHDSTVLESYLDHLEPVFSTLAACETTGELLEHLPDGPAQAGFQRLA